MQEFIDGDIRNLAIGLVAAITTRYDVSLGISIPLTALLLKRGIANCCAQAKPERPKYSVKRILAKYTPRTTIKKGSELLGYRVEEYQDVQDAEMNEKDLLQALLLQPPFTKYIKVKPPRKSRSR